MTITFKQEFKKAILNGEKTATIRNTKHYNAGTIFKLNLGTRFKPETIGKARCTSLIEIRVKNLLESLVYAIKENRGNNSTFNLDLFNFTTIQIRPSALGFETLRDAHAFYKSHLKNQYAYVHIFELIKE